MSVRLAAMADIHYTRQSQGVLKPLFSHISDSADVLLLCGDITDRGLPEEAHFFVKDLKESVRIPVIAVLGNHDYESGASKEVTDILGNAGIVLLDGSGYEIYGVGFVGVKGFAGGFGQRALQPWGEEAIKNFVGEASKEALKLGNSLSRIQAGQIVALLHYAPVRETIVGEHPEVFAFLGSHRLEEPLNNFPVRAIFHGHAHNGVPEGRTQKNIPVYNVSMPLLKKNFPERMPFRLIEIQSDTGDAFAQHEQNNSALPCTLDGINRDDSAVEAFYRNVLKTLIKANIPFLVGGTYAFMIYTGIERSTKDLDLFIRPEDFGRIMKVFSAEGYKTEIAEPHWLGKIFSGDKMVDIIFGSGNTLIKVNDQWFINARDDTVLGIGVKLCPVEEIIWTGAFVMERDRFDGADIAHLLRACSDEIEWHRLLEMFGPNWQVLFCHLLLFHFIYPSERVRIPVWVMKTLMGNLERELKSNLPLERICWGTLLSRTQYMFDIDRDGYRDGRYANRH